MSRRPDAEPRETGPAARVGAGWGWCLLLMPTSVLCLACQEPEERPALIEVCESPNCRPPAMGKGAGASQSSSSTTSSGSDEVTLAGDLWLLDDDSFSLNRAAPYEEVATVYGFDPQNRLISAPYDGSMFTLSGVLPSAAAMVLVTPEDEQALPMPTLLRVDTQQSTQVSLPLLRRSVLEEMFVTLTAQVTVDPDRAQVILQFLDAELAPLAGVEVSIASAGFVAYATADGYSDVLGETSERGLVLAGNVAASDLPGTSINAQVSGAIAGQQVVQVVQGAVSYELIVAD